jgi:23S rRNA (cytidine2498-2'-O)-methyltransferase
MCCRQGNNPGQRSTNTSSRFEFTETSMTQGLFSCEPGWEEPLADELGRVFAGSAREALSGGWVAADYDAPRLPRQPCLALVRQSLPAAQPVEAPSIAAWSRWFGDWLIERLAGHDGPWRCHLFANPGPQPAVPSRRAELIGSEVDRLLRKKQRRLLRTRVERWQTPFAADEALVQLALVEPGRGFVSCCSPEEVARWRHCLSRFPAGMVSVRAAREAPSRAMEKLAEAELRLCRPIAPGETCIDLGSSPGSWAWHALGQGAQVVAVDRSPLRADLMAHPRLSFVRGDAFQYRPEQPVDWLLCDVIAFPQRTLELLAHWLRGGWCRYFCVTIKFRGRDDYPLLEAFKAELDRHAEAYCLRRLTSNKNEVMAAGRAKLSPASPER